MEEVQPDSEEEEGTTSSRKIKPLGPVFSTGDLAKVLGWSTQKTRRLVKKIGLDLKSGNKGKILITYADLIERAPELYHSLVLSGAIRIGNDT